MFGEPLWSSKNIYGCQVVDTINKEIFSNLIQEKIKIIYAKLLFIRLLENYKKGGNRWKNLL